MRDGGVDALALAAVLGRIVENVEKHLPHPRHVTGDLWNVFLAAVVVQADALLLQPVAVHEDSIFKLRQDIGRFDMQCKAAVLHPREFQQLLDHTGQPLGLPRDDDDAAARLRVQVFRRQQRLAPAGDGCEGRPQLVRDRGNELRLRLFSLPDLDGHIVDRADQLADLIIVLPGDLHAVGAGGDALGRRVDLRDRHKDGADKKTAQKEDRADEQKPDRHRDERNHKDLQVRVAQARHIAQHADDLAVGVDHRAGHSEDALAGQGVAALVVPGLLAVDGLLDLRRGGRAAREFPVGGGNDLAARRDELQLQPVFIFKRLGKFDAGLIVFVVALANIIAEKIGCRVRPVFKAGAQVRIVIGRHGEHDAKHARQHQQHDDAHIVHEPAPLDAGQPFLFLQAFSPRAPYRRFPASSQAPHLYPKPQTVVM